jgi:hypothetical protein
VALPKAARARGNDVGIGGGAPEIGVVIDARIPAASELSDQARARKDGVSRFADGTIVESRPSSTIETGPNRGGVLQELKVPEHSHLWNQENLALGKTPRICESSAYIELQAVEILLSYPQI